MGTIKLTVRETAERKGITNPHALSKATGLNYAICHRLWNDEGNTTLVSLPTLAALCDGLKVKPAQLLDYQPGE